LVVKTGKEIKGINKSKKNERNEGDYGLLSFEYFERIAIPDMAMPTAARTKGMEYPGMGLSGGFVVVVKIIGRQYSLPAERASLPTYNRPLTIAGEHVIRPAVV
jgi:hypothetical protein